MCAALRRRPPIWLLVLAVVGGCLLLIVAVTRWGTPSDEYAYWLAARRLAEGAAVYDPSAQPGTPYAYFYPPPLAQVLAPLTLFVPDPVFVALWTLLLLVCLAWIAHGRVLVALALIAFIPVAVELWYRNIHLVIVVLIVLGLRRSSAWLAVGAAIKGGPVLAMVYFVAARRYRDAIIMGVAGLVMLALSAVLAPDLWRRFLEVVAAGAPGVGASIVPVPFAVRLALALFVAFSAGVLRGRVASASSPETGLRDERIAEALLVGAIILANPTLWVTSLSMLIAILPLWETARRRPPDS